MTAGKTATKDAARQRWATILERIGQVFFGVAGTLFFLFASSLLGIAAYQFVEGALTSDALLRRTLKSIGLVIIGIAVFDLAKFLVEEELLRERELRSLSEARMSLTKFFTIIILAILLEGIVIVFETKLDNLPGLIYPTALIATGVLALVGLGLFQRLTADARTTDPTADDPEPSEGEAGLQAAEAKAAEIRSGNGGSSG